MTDGPKKIRKGIIANTYKIRDNTKTTLPYHQQRLLEDNLMLFKTPNYRSNLPDWGIMRLLHEYRQSNMQDQYQQKSPESHILDILNESETYNKKAAEIISLLSQDKKLQHQSGVFISPTSGGKRKTDYYPEEKPLKKKRKYIKSSRSKTPQPPTNEGNRQLYKVKGYDKFFIYGGGPLDKKQKQLDNQNASGTSIQKSSSSSSLQEEDLTSSSSSSEEEEEEDSSSSSSSSEEEGDSSSGQSSSSEDEEERF
jgi:hypothetical protein